MNRVHLNFIMAEDKIMIIYVKKTKLKSNILGFELNKKKINI